MEKITDRAVEGVIVLMTFLMPLIGFLVLALALWAGQLFEG